MSLYHSDHTQKQPIMAESKQQQPSPNVRADSNTNVRADLQSDRREYQDLKSSSPRPRPCPQDCTACSIQQQVFCSTRMLFTLSRTLQNIQQQLTALQAQLQSKDPDNPFSIPPIENP